MNGVNCLKDVSWRVVIMKTKLSFIWSCNGVSYFFTAIQPEDVLRWVSLGLTIIATIVSLAFTIYTWWKKASADGKITEDEVNDLLDQISVLQNQLEKEKENEVRGQNQGNERESQESINTGKSRPDNYVR